MKNKTQYSKTILATAVTLALAVITTNASGAEGFKTRQTPMGIFGGEIAAQADQPGFFGTVLLSSVRIDKVAGDGSGGDAQLPARSAPIPAALPGGPYTVSVPANTFTIHHTQTNLNLVGGYLTESVYAGGRIALAINVPYVSMDRTFSLSPITSSVSPTPSSPPIPAAALPSVKAGIAGAQAQIVSAYQTQVLASQNASVNGIGDTEFSAVWIRHQDRLKVAAGVSVFLPTGVYDKTRGPNPGYGNFYSVRPGVALTYSLNKDHKAEAWDSGITIAGRFSMMFNGTNSDTDYRTGNIAYAEAAIVKVMGDWAIGTNLMRVQQVTDDSGAGVAAAGFTSPMALRVNSIGPFLSYKLPGKNAGLNLTYSHNFDGRNAQLADILQLRFISTW